MNGEFKLWLEKELDKRNWNRHDLAVNANISDSAVSMIMSESRGVGIDVLQAIAKAFGYKRAIVYSAAGLIDPMDPVDADTEEANAIMRQLPPNDRDEYLRIGWLKVELQKRRKPLPTEEMQQSDK